MEYCYQQSYQLIVRTFSAHSCEHEVLPKPKLCPIEAKHWTACHGRASSSRGTVPIHPYPVLHSTVLYCTVLYYTIL